VRGMSVTREHNVSTRRGGFVSTNVIGDR